MAEPLLKLDECNAVTGLISSWYRFQTDVAYRFDLLRYADVPLNERDPYNVSGPLAVFAGSVKLDGPARQAAPTLIRQLNSTGALCKRNRDGTLVYDAAGNSVSSGINPIVLYLQHVLREFRRDYAAKEVRPEASMIFFDRFTSTLDALVSKYAPG